MCHYIAELIEKYASSKNELDKYQIGNECSKLILDLWKFILKKKKLKIEGIINKKLKIFIDNNGTTFPILYRSVNDPDSIKDLNNDEKIELIQSISEVEDYLIEFYSFSIQYSKKINKADDFSPAERIIFNQIRDKISKIFLSFKDLNMENQEIIAKNIFSALGSLNYLKNLVFYSENIEKEADLMHKFSKETGKNPIWGGKETKAYKIWKNKQNQ